MEASFRRKSLNRTQTNVEPDHDFYTDWNYKPLDIILKLCPKLFCVTCADTEDLKLCYSLWFMSTALVARDIEI